MEIKDSDKFNLARLLMGAGCYLDKVPIADPSLTGRQIIEILEKAKNG